MQWIVLSGALGLMLGLVPLFTGILKKNIKFGIFGLLASTVGGAVLGLILALPVAAIFTWLIIRDSKKPQKVTFADENPNDVNLSQRDNQ